MSATHLEAPIGDQSYRLLPDSVHAPPRGTIGERFQNTAEPRVVGREGVTLMRGERVRYRYYVVGSDLASVTAKFKVDPEHVAGLEPAEDYPPPPGLDIYMKVPSWSAWLVVSVSLLVMILAIAYSTAWLVRLLRRIRWKQ